MDTAHRIDYFEEAKRRHDLVEFLRTQLGVEPKKIGRHYRFSACPEPTCGESSKHSQKLRVTEDSSTFTCYRCGAHGSVVDAAALLWGKEPLEAAKELVGDRPVLVDPAELERQKAARAERKRLADLERARQARIMREVDGRILALCQRFANEAAPLQYLTGLNADERAISERVIREAQQRRLLGFLPGDPDEAAWQLEHAIGRDLLVAAGMWKPDKKVPAIVFKPIVFFYPGLYSAEFRMIGAPRRAEQLKSISYGTPYYPWYWEGQDPSIALLNEGVIDSLSAVDMGYPGHILGLPGIRNWDLEWILAFAKERGVRTFHIAFDDDVDSDDNPGQEAAQELIKTIQQYGLSAYAASPKGGDLNDELRRKKGVLK